MTAKMRKVDLLESEYKSKDCKILEAHYLDVVRIISDTYNINNFVVNLETFNKIKSTKAVDGKILIPINSTKVNDTELLPHNIIPKEMFCAFDDTQTIIYYGSFKECISNITKHDSNK